MVSDKIKISNPSGFHLRPAGMFCETAVSFDSSIRFKKGERDYNAKSVLSVLGAGVKSGDEIEIICEGSDEAEAIESLLELVRSGFGEWKSA